VHSRAYLESPSLRVSLREGKAQISAVAEKCEHGSGGVGTPEKPAPGSVCTCQLGASLGLAWL
jgi:hypothetical protein